MSLEQLTVVCNGREYREWESIRVEWTKGEPETPIAMLTTSEVIQRQHGESIEPEDVFQKWNLPPGAFVSIFGNDHDLLMHGWVHAYMPATDPEQHSIQLVIKPMTYKFVMSSAFIESMHIEGMRDLDFANLLAAPFGVGIIDLSLPFFVKKFQLRMGSTNFAELMRLMGPLGKILYTARDGRLVITDGVPWPEVGGRGYLVQGVNIIKMAAKLTATGSGWMSETIGQSAEGVDLPTALQPGGLSVSAMQSMFRMILTQTQAVSDIVGAEAAWINARTHGRDVSATITVPGWRKPSDNGYWDLDTDAYVYAPFLKIDCVMRIAKIVYSQAIGEGTTTELTLNSPKANGLAGTELFACESNPLWFVPPFMGRRPNPDEEEEVPPGGINPPIGTPIP